MIVGFGFGLVQPLYTLAAQHVAPRTRMGAATAAVQFGRSIGATVGVAVFGSMLLQIYHSALGPTVAAQFPNPLEFRDAAASAPMPEVVRAALASALHVVFGAAAILMAACVGLNFFLPSPVPEAEQEPSREQTIEV
jgi:hypothetical protein